jgi:hypothetical protein
MEIPDSLCSADRVGGRTWSMYQKGSFLRQADCCIISSKQNIFDDSLLRVFNKARFPRSIDTRMGSWYREALQVVLPGGLTALGLKLKETAISLSY